jgi:hypothetical protein
MRQMTGGCLCGAVRYRLTGEPAMVAMCHCRTCQRNTGSAFSTNVAMRREAVVVAGNTVTTYETRPEDGGPPFYRSFCSRCGSPVCAYGEAYPGILFVKAGTLDDPTAVAPTVQLWCSEQLPWVPTDVRTPRFAGHRQERSPALHPRPASGGPE